MKRMLLAWATLIILQLACGQSAGAPSITPTIRRSSPPTITPTRRPNGQSPNAAAVTAAARTAIARTRSAALTEVAYYGNGTQPAEQNDAETATADAATQMANVFAPAPVVVPALECPGLLKSRLILGSRAQVISIDGTAKLVHVNPGFSEDASDKVAEGTFLTIIDGPKCVDESTWWYVQTDDGVKGWMAE